MTSDNPVIFNFTYYKQQKRQGNDYIKAGIEKIKIIANLEKSTAYIKATYPHPERAHRQIGVELYFPISPYICICIYDKQGNVKPLPIRKLNKEIILQANESIFSHKKDFAFVEKILKKNPESRDNLYIFIYKKVDKKLLSNKLLVSFCSKFETKIGFIFYIRRHI